MKKVAAFPWIPDARKNRTHHRNNVTQATSDLVFRAIRHVYRFANVLRACRAHSAKSEIEERIEAAATHLFRGRVRGEQKGKGRGGEKEARVQN